MIGVAIFVEREMGAGHHAKRGDFRSEVFQIIEYANHDRHAAFVPEDLRAVGLAVGVNADAGVAGFRAGVAVMRQQDFVAQELLEEGDGGGVGNQLGDRTPP